MCKHILNAMVYFKTDCCAEWFECSECHDEQKTHTFQIGKFVKMTCKSCRKVFDRDLNMFTQQDNFCSVCGICWCQPGITPESTILEESSTFTDEFLEVLIDPSNENFGEKKQKKTRKKNKRK